MQIFALACCTWTGKGKNVQMHVVTLSFDKYSSPKETLHTKYPRYRSKFFYIVSKSCTAEQRPDPQWFVLWLDGMVGFAGRSVLIGLP